MSYEGRRHLLATLGDVEARRAKLLRREDVPSRSLDELLPESIVLDAPDGNTFDVSVADVTAAQGGGGDEARIKLLTENIPGHRVKHVAKILDLKPFNRKNDVFIPEIAAATSDAKAVSAAVTRKLMGAALQREKTKGAFVKFFGLDLADAGGGGGGSTIVLDVTARFDRSTLDTATVDFSFSDPDVVHQLLRDAGLVEAGKSWNCESNNVVRKSGRKRRTARIEVSCPVDASKLAGASAASTAIPVGFVEFGGQVLRRFFCG